MNFRTILTKYNHLNPELTTAFIEAFENRRFDIVGSIIPEYNELHSTEKSKFHNAFKRIVDGSYMDYPDRPSAFDIKDKRARREAKRFNSLAEYDRWARRNGEDS